VDFYQIALKTGKNGVSEIYPDFVVTRSKDLMVRGRSFYAIWDEEKNLWSTDEYDVQRLVDISLRAYAEKYKETEGVTLTVRDLKSFNSNSWNQFRKYMNQISDNSHQLDEKLIFANTPVKKEDYVSRRLPYSLAPGDYSAWDELVGTLYSVDERAKIEWAIGSIIAGDSKKIQKFLVLYGPAGTGKSTVLNIIEKLFVGYTASFEAKALGGGNNAFATEAFKHNPLVAIQHDGDLSKIEDNTKLNSIIAHEDMMMNEKYKPSYTARVNAFLFMGTNQPVKISDAKSGIIRRLIDVHPTGVHIPVNHYHTLMSRVDFELGAIAEHCLAVYRTMGKNYYNSYRPLEMMFQTDVFFNFIEAHYDLFKSQNGTTLKQAYGLYREYCEETGVDRKLPQYKIREELRHYFEDFHTRASIDGVDVRSYYSGFTASKFKVADKKDKTFSLALEETESLLDPVLSSMPAQYGNSDELPESKWDNVTHILADLDTSKLHYVKIPEHHIVIDFDLVDEHGNKSLEMNLEAASVWPATYAELSKGGNGVHLHYEYVGDKSELASVYSNGIEIKTLLGNASLRRRLSKCNNIPIAKISGGLPIKEKKVLPTQTIQSERGLRDLIARNLKKEIHPGTKSSVDFIHKILEDAYLSGMVYDVTDLRPKIIAFANNSQNQPLPALKMVQRMHFKSEETEVHKTQTPTDDRIVFFDVEVYPNLFIVCWKYRGSSEVIRMINPTPKEIELLFKFKLVGFYNRKYDNHILYARFLGYDNDALYKLSNKIVNGKNQGLFGEAYRLSYTDIWEFSSKKASLKKFEIDLKITHKELDIPWDKPVDERDIPRIVEYCVNDVVASEKVFEARYQDFVARQILADLSGLTVNDTTQQHTARIIFGNDRNPQSSFNYTDLSKDFPGYVFDMGKSYYRDEMPGEGGYVYAEPGMYSNVVLLDIASMHPTSIEILNLFGDEYTPNFAALKAARLAIKHKDYAAAKKMMKGKLAPYLENPENADALAYALKIVINTVYGLTAAKFENPFRDNRNVDNIVAKRGALFMIDLKHFVQGLGYQVVHIKTDSIKIPNATEEIIEAVMDFGLKYGYTFENEGIYDKFCLVNDAVYIAKHGEPPYKWDAVGAQFQHPYVFKTLFSKEPITRDDLCETKQVTQGAMYLEFNIDRPMIFPDEMQFVGRTGRFVPVTAESGGAILYRVKDGKHYAVTGTKGYLWMEASMADWDRIEIDMRYFENLVYEAGKTISSFGDFGKFVMDCE
jgi:energy-coupling factor transporter ATP-binding protein EcfA2